MKNCIEKDLKILEGAAHEWCFGLSSPDGSSLPIGDYVIYGSAACPGEAPRAFAVTIEGETATARMPGLPMADSPWMYQLFAQERSSTVEWLIACGNVNLIPRCAGAGVKLDPAQERGVAVLDRETTCATFVIGDNMASVAANTRLAGEHAKAAATSETNAGESAKAAATSETNAGESAKAAATSETNAGESAKAAATSETNAGESAKAAATSETNAGESAKAAATSETNAGNSAKEAGESKEAAETAEAGAESARAASESKAHEAAEHAADARRRKEEIEKREGSYAEHMENTTRHLTATEHRHLTRLIRDFPEVDPDSPDTPDPPEESVAPDAALSNAFMLEFFAKHAQPGAAQAPPAVYPSRVPHGRKDENGAWVNNASAVNEEVYGATRKFMDNAGLQHACSTDTEEGVDDYNGKLWPFFWGRGNYVTDEYGVKWLTAIKGQVINGVSFDPDKPTCTFGPSYYGFNVLERWQDAETEQWTTHDGTAEGTPLFEIYGISARGWDDLDVSRQTELERHGVTAADFNLCPGCYAWDPVDKQPVPRPYWICSAYCGGAEEAAEGVVNLVSKRNLPLLNNMSHNSLVAKYGYKPGFGGGAWVNGQGFLFDVVKNATKNSQSIHSGMASNSCNAVKAAQNTANADYLFPIASQGTFRPGCTVWLWQTNANSTATTYRRSVAVQIGRIKAIETRTLTLADGGEAESLCLVIDPETVQPFVTRTAETDADAIAATKELTDQGVYACCYATQGMALAGETDSVLGLHDGSCTSFSDSRHPYRVQGVEYMPGVYMTAADTIAIKGDGVIDVEIDGEVIIPLASEYVVLQAPLGVTRKTSGGLQAYLDHGYIPVGIVPAAASGWIVNCKLTSTGVLIPVGVGGSGSSDGLGHADHLYVGANPAEFLMGGSLVHGGYAGSAYLTLSLGLGHSSWTIGARD